MPLAPESTWAGSWAGAGTLKGGLMGLFSRKDKKAKAKTPKAPKPRRGTRAYDASATGYRYDGWTTTSSSANAEVAGGLVSMRDRSRDAYRNQSWAKGTVDKVVAHLVGSGIRPDLDSGDATLDGRALKLWERWSKKCYPSNRSNLAAIQTLLARSWWESGEVFVRFRQRRLSDLPGLPPIQLQVLEADLCDHTKNETLSNGGRIVQGIEFDALDRRVAYHFHASHPGDSYSYSGGVGYGKTVRVPSSQVLHLYSELRPGQVRGIPHLHALLSALYDISGYLDAERYRAKGAASTMAWISGGDPDEGVPTGVDGVAPAEDEWGDLVQDADGNPVEQMRPGWVAYLPSGKEVTINQPGVPSGIADYVSTSLHEVAAGSPLSYASLTGDLSKTSFSSTKFGLTEQNMILRALREQVFVPLILDPLWEIWVGQAIAAGLLPDRDSLLDVKWSRPRVESADRLNEAKADMVEMRLGTRSRREIISGYGRDPDQVDSEIALDADKRDELGIVSDGDPSQVTLSGGLQATLLDDDSEAKE